MDYTEIMNRSFMDMGIYACNKSIYDVYGKFGTNLRRKIDYDFILRMARTEKIFFIPKSLLHYNIGDYPSIYNTESCEEVSINHI